MSETIEIEVSEDDITAYLQDEDGREIGFCMLDENGIEQEYFYAEEETSSDDDEELIPGSGVTKAKLKEGAASVKEGREVAKELKDAMRDITGVLKDLKI